MRLSRISLSLRLTLWFASIFLLGWVAFGAAMWLTLKHSLTQERHSMLAHRLNRLQDVLVKTQGEDQANRIQDFENFAHATGNGLSEIFRADGSHYFPSPSAAAEAFPWPAMDDSKAEIFRSVNASGDFYWVVARPWRLGGERVYLMAAAPSITSRVILDEFSSGLLASAPLLLAVSSLGSYLLSRRALRPVDRITVTARSISIRNLSERLPNDTRSDELQRLTETFNAMLERLESAVGQIKQFTADASHELRGPLSFVRTVSEVALRNPNINTDSREAFTDIVSEVAKAAVLLEDMLTLARADARSAEAVLEPLDVAPVLRNAYERALPIATERGLSLSSRIPSDEPAWAIADELTLRRLFWIVLDNAIKYTPTPGKIAVSLRSVNTDLLIEVSDTGVGIPAADLPFIFNRFYRADPSRSQTEGSGLGLAIAKWIADLHGAVLSVSSEIDKGTTVQLRLPASTDRDSRTLNKIRTEEHKDARAIGLPARL